MVVVGFIVCIALESQILIDTVAEASDLVAESFVAEVVSRVRPKGPIDGRHHVHRRLSRKRAMWLS